MTFQSSYTKVQLQMDTSLIKNKREFAKRMMLEGMRLALESARSDQFPEFGFEATDRIETAIKEVEAE
jgi:hypothetical protein